MTISFHASLSQDAHKRATERLNIQQLILRIKAHEINIELRYMQAQELENKIYEAIQGEKYEERNVIREFNDFQNSPHIELNENVTPINKKIFLQQKNNIKNIMGAIGRGDFNIYEKLKIIKVLLSRAKLAGEIEVAKDLSSNENEWRDIDYEKIIRAKEMIPHDRIEYKNDVKYLKVLGIIYLYYTQFWRIIETLGDAYNDIQILIKKREEIEQYEFFFEQTICFGKKQPSKYISIGATRIDFINSSIEDRQAIVLLYSLLQKPGERIETFKTYYENYCTLFGMQRTRIQAETIRKYYVSRLNSFLKKHKLPVICKRNIEGIYLEIIC